MNYSLSFFFELLWLAGSVAEVEGGGNADLRAYQRWPGGEQGGRCQEGRAREEDPNVHRLRSKSLLLLS